MTPEYNGIMENLRKFEEFLRLWCLCVSYVMKL